MGQCDHSCIQSRKKTATLTNDRVTAVAHHYTVDTGSAMPLMPRFHQQSGGSCMVGATLALALACARPGLRSPCLALSGAYPTPPVERR
jgi:hypothetical protein